MSPSELPIPPYYHGSPTHSARNTCVASDDDFLDWNAVYTDLGGTSDPRTIFPESFSLIMNVLGIKIYCLLSRQLLLTLGASQSPESSQGGNALDAVGIWRLWPALE
ncbi:hypothetical protein BGX31_000978 [Mortierella sp. GBA43]|nr:hypothetical protein BGX31_000978 [Mortierella sp. GBA43]